MALAAGKRTRSTRSMKQSVKSAAPARKSLRSQACAEPVTRNEAMDRRAVAPPESSCSSRSVRPRPARAKGRECGSSFATYPQAVDKTGAPQ